MIHLKWSLFFLHEAEAREGETTYSSAVARTGPRVNLGASQKQSKLEPDLDNWSETLGWGKLRDTESASSRMKYIYPSVQ